MFKTIVTAIEYTSEAVQTATNYSIKQTGDKSTAKLTKYPRTRSSQLPPLASWLSM